MKKEKVIEIHENIIKLSEDYIQFINTVPMNKTILLQTSLHYYMRKENITFNSVVKVIGFNKDSVRVRTIAIEKADYHPFNTLKWKNKKGEQVTDTIIKINTLKNFKWTAVSKEDLPLFIDYEFKSCLYDAILSGNHPI